MRIQIQRNRNRKNGITKDDKFLGNNAASINIKKATIFGKLLLWSQDSVCRPISGLSFRYFAYVLAIQGKTDRHSRLELGRQQQQQQQNDDGPGLLGPAPGCGFNPLLFLQNAHNRGPAMSKFFFAGFFMSPPS